MPTRPIMLARAYESVGTERSLLQEWGTEELTSNLTSVGNDRGGAIAISNAFGRVQVGHTDFVLIPAVSLFFHFYDACRAHAQGWFPTTNHARASSAPLQYIRYHIIRTRCNRTFASTRPQRLSAAPLKLFFSFASLAAQHQRCQVPLSVAKYEEHFHNIIQSKIDISAHSGTWDNS